MLGLHHVYAGAAEPLFYDHPVRNGGGTRFAAADRDAPDGWRRHESGSWVMLTPLTARLPAQGWKVHVSAPARQAEEVVELVHGWCLTAEVAHKFLPDHATVLLSNSKYARRGSSGKLMALYARDERELRRILSELSPLLAGRNGPYILGDLRWQDGPLYLRYGGFTQRWCTTGSGERVLALARPDGTLVPDRRGPVFRVPEWVEPPGFVAEEIHAQGAAGAGQTMPYRIERALHFSNGGGIYLAHDPGTRRRLVLREARPLAGLDGSGRDAVTRLRREAEALRTLDGLDIAPRLLDEFQVWEHHYLAQEYLEGDTLWHFMVRNNPLTRPVSAPGQVARYTAQALDVIDRLQTALDAVHARGLVFGDLHPGNVILQPDGRVRLVDFEAAYRPDRDRPPAMGCPGYLAPPSVTGPARDQYALDCLRLSMFLPLSVLFDLDPGKVDELADAVHDWFPVPRSYVEHARRGLRRPGAPPPGARRRSAAPAAPAVLGDDPALGLRDALARAINAGATPDRDDRLYPGDPAGLHDGGHTIAHGAAGVLLALSATGHDVDPAHVDWLARAALRTPDPRPGLYGGLHGAALALHELGRPDEALRVLERAGDTSEASLHGGLAGVGLTLRHLAVAGGVSGLDDRLADVTERLTACLATGHHSGAGLLQGGSGIAEFFLQRYEDERDSGHLDLAARALRADLAHCRTSEEGVVNLQDGNRLLPYLRSGSAGVGLVLGHYLRHRHDDEFARVLPGIVLAAQARFTIHPGLFNGRAGLAVLLAQHRGRPDADEALARHLRLLSWHAIPYADGVAFPGEQLLRLSMDVATGTAGILLALHAAAGNALPLPGLVPAHLAPTA